MTDSQPEISPGPPPERARAGRRWWEAAAAALLLAAAALFVLGPILPDLGSAIVGDPDTDAVRGMWGFDHVRRSLLPPDWLLWSREVNFPRGVLAVILPQVTAVLASPLGLLVGPVAGWNLTVGALLWACGMGTAWLVRVCTGSWASGTVAGAAMMSAPMLLFAVSDGTSEHAAFWAVPVALGAMAMALGEGRPLWGAAAGALAVVVAVDSPYNAIFAVIPGAALVLTTVPRRRSPTRRTDLLRTAAAMAATTLAGALLLFLLYRNFSFGEPSAGGAGVLLARNATDLGTWWRADWGPREGREVGLAPTNIPALVFLPAALLALLGRWRGWVWLGASLSMIGLSFGLNERIGNELSYWVGGLGQPLGEALLSVNARLFELPGLSMLRFPQRWLVPANLALLVGASYGLARLRRGLARWPGRAWAFRGVAALSAAACVVTGLRTARWDLDFPRQELPRATFALWLGEQPGHGAVLLLPQLRPAPTTGRRGDVPVFANLAESLSSSDMLYLQTVHGKPMVAYPNLKTLAPFRVGEQTWRQYRHWDDLTHPALTGNPIPRAAADPAQQPERRAVVAYLHAAGLRYVAVDLGCYGEEALEVLRGDFGAVLAEERRFDDGDGVLVLVLAPAP